MIENPALGFNSCSLCGHGGTSGSILARIREYVTFYANSDADLSDDMAIGRQEVSKSVMEILNEAEPVPAPRLEWREDVGDWRADDGWLIEASRTLVPNSPTIRLVIKERGYSLWKHRINPWAAEPLAQGLTLDAAKSLAEQLNAVLSPPVGPQPKGTS